MADIKIKIQTSADLAALEALNREFKGAANNAKLFQEQAAKTNASLTAEQDKVGKSARESASAFDELLGAQENESEAARENKKNTEKLTVSKKTLKDSIKELGHAFPSVGAAMLLLKNPITIMIGLFAAIITSVRSYGKALDELQAKNRAHENISKAMFTLGGASADASKNISDFIKSMDDAAGKADTLKGKLDAVNDAILRQSRQQDELRDANEAAELSGIDEQQKSGKIPLSKAILLRQGVKSKYSARRESDQRRLEEEQQESRNEALRKQMEERVKAEAQLPEAERVASELERAAKSAPDKAKSDLDVIGSEREKVQSRIDELLAQRGGVQMIGLEAIAKISPSGSAAAKAPAGMRARIDEELDKLTPRLGELNEQEATVKARLEKAPIDAKKARERVSNLQSEIIIGRENEGALFGQIVSSGQRNKSDQFQREKVGFINQKAQEGITAAEYSAALAAELDKYNKAVIKSIKDQIKANINEVESKRPG